MTEHQNNVIGPFPFDVWRALRDLRSDIAWMKKCNENKYKNMIEPETKVFNLMLREYSIAV